MTPTPTTRQQEPTSIRKLQILIDQGSTDLALELMHTQNLQVEIINGRVIDKSDATESWLARFITVNPLMNELKNDVRKLALVDDNVLISGETGTGKELIARALHGKRKRFIALNCAGMPEGLVESELFGYAANSFTGSAGKPRAGLMQEAANGTLFLDEVGELPLNIQAKLLRTIQERVVRKVGGTNDEPLTCRIVCATHRSLVDMIEAKQFRQDLYARISTFELKTLPLRERVEDIQPLLSSMEGGKELLVVATGKPLNLSLNVRGLQQAVRRYKVLGKLPS